MNRAMPRGSPAGRGSTTYMLIEDSSTQSPANGKAMQDWRSHSDSFSSPGALNLALSQPIQDSLSTLKPHLRNGDTGIANGVGKSDHSALLEPFKSPMSSLSGSGQSRSRRGCAVSLGTTMLICFVSAFIFISMLGSRSSAYNLRLVPRLGIYRSYRRLQVETVVDPLIKAGIFGHGSARLKELPMCEGSVEDSVPCYDAYGNQDVGLLTGRGINRHCKARSEEKECLIPPPEGYRIPLRWPLSRDGVWRGNMKFVEPYSLSGRRLTRLKIGADDVATLDLAVAGLDGLDKHVQQVKDAMAVEWVNQIELVRILDINCGLSRLRDYYRDYFEKSSILCVAHHETNGSQVQYALERGYPAMIGSLISTQLPYPSSSFDMIHTLDTVFDWASKEGLLELLELDRLLKPGGLFVWTFQAATTSESFFTTSKQDWEDRNKELASRVCWSVVLEAEQTLIWKKTSNQSCYSPIRSPEETPKLCGKLDDNAAWYPTLRTCITRPLVGDDDSSLQKRLDERPKAANGFSLEELSGYSTIWATTVKSYWSLLTPLIFSDHPKRPGEEDPPPPSNIIRNIMDMNAMYGSLNSALLEARKPVWVMNVVPQSGPDTLPSIYKHGFIGAQHDWCEAFPTYPRTYDLLHGIGLLSQEAARPNGCALSTLFLEMDRILRPEGWVILRDREERIEDARIAAGQMRWESRVIQVEGLEGQQLLICQKIFWKSPSTKAIL